MDASMLSDERGDGDGEDQSHEEEDEDAVDHGEDEQDDEETTHRIRATLETITASYKELQFFLTISSAKPGNGVEHLRDGNTTDTFWQSDGE
jgi:Anaphase-promoting complex, subunit 10 (APC10)